MDPPGTTPGLIGSPMAVPDRSCLGTGMQFDVHWVVSLSIEPENHRQMMGFQSSISTYFYMFACFKLISCNSSHCNLLIPTKGVHLGFPSQTSKPPGFHVGELGRDNPHRPGVPR